MRETAVQVPEQAGAGVPRRRRLVCREWLVRRPAGPGLCPGGTRPPSPCGRRSRPRTRPARRAAAGRARGGGLAAEGLPPLPRAALTCSQNYPPGRGESVQLRPETGRDQPVFAPYSRTIRAGTPATTHRSGISPRTTEPAATTTLRP